jgi:monooxygenase
VVVYHGEFRLSKEDFDTLIKPAIGHSNILAGVGDAFNTPITICHINNKHVDLDWSYSRAIRGEDNDNDPLFRPLQTAAEARQVPKELLDEIQSRKLAPPWSQIINEEQIRKNGLFNWLSRCVFLSRPDLDQAVKHGVVFVGDSWHAMPIFGGEGGNHALLDTVELARAFQERSTFDELESAIRTYYDSAWRRCQDAVRRSRQRFYLLHRPMEEWRKFAEQHKKMKEQTE